MRFIQSMQCSLLSEYWFIFPKVTVNYRIRPIYQPNRCVILQVIWNDSILTLLDLSAEFLCAAESTNRQINFRRWHAGPGLMLLVKRTSVNCIIDIRMKYRQKKLRLRSRVHYVLVLAHGAWLYESRLGYDLAIAYDYYWQRQQPQCSNFNNSYVLYFLRCHLA